jgi:hypothetical protein
MVAIMRDNISKITDRVRVFSRGLMVAGTLARGRRAKCMVRELTGTQMALKPKEFGLRDSAL